MRYREFCAIVKKEITGLDTESRDVSPFLRTAYESMPRGLTPEQQELHAKTWISGYQCGRLSANMKSRELLSGLGRIITRD